MLLWSTIVIAREYYLLCARSILSRGIRISAVILQQIHIVYYARYILLQKILLDIIAIHEYNNFIEAFLVFLCGALSLLVSEHLLNKNNVIVLKIEGK